MTARPSDCTICDTMTTKQPIADTLKAAILASELPYLTLQEETGVTRQSLMSFVKDERTLRLDMADKLAAYFKLELRPATRKPATKAAPKRKGK